MGFSDAEVLAAVRAFLGAPGAVTTGFGFDGVRREGGDLVVGFRWRRDPNGYAVRIPLPAQDRQSPWTGCPVDTAEQWAADLSGLLAEELGTGAVRRARRTRRDGVVELDFGQPSDFVPRGYCIGAVPPYPGTGRWLAECGLDITAPTRDRADGRLLSWLQLTTDTAQPRPRGHVSAAWHRGRPGTAELRVLEVLPGVPDAAAVVLARMVAHDAAEAGARRVLAGVADDRLRDAGFEPGPGSWILDTTGP